MADRKTRRFGARNEGADSLKGSLSPAPIGLRDVLAAAPDVVFCCDHLGRWVWISPAIEALVGYKPDDLIGHVCTGLIAPVERTAAARHLLRLRRSKHQAGNEFECSVMSLSGHVLRVAFRLNRIERPDGDPAFVGIARRGSNRSTGFRVLTADDSVALSGGSSKPYAAPQHRNDPTGSAPRGDAPGWTASQFNDLDARLSTPAGAGANGADAAADSAAQAAAMAELAETRAALETVRAAEAEARQQIETVRTSEAGALLRLERADADRARAERERDDARRERDSARDEVQAAEAKLEEARWPPADGEEPPELTRMRAERDEAQALLRDRSDHFASVSHEIRTPMNGVIGMAQLLLEMNLDSEQREMIEVIRQSSHSLLAIINDAVEFSRLDSGRLEIESMDFDLRVTVEQIAALLAPVAHQKGLELEAQIHHDVPSRVTGDPGRLRQVLLNLAGNALRLTERGVLRVRVERTEEHEDTVSLRFAIDARGDGITPEHVNGLLQSFVQTDPAVARRYGGTGLGLYVSQRLIALMGGRVGVGRDADHVCSLSFDLALRKQQSAPPRPAEAGTVELAGLRTLIVDPSSSLRQSMGEILEAWGARVDVASNRDEAMEKLRAAWEAKDPVQVAFIDFQLPGVTGEQLGEEIRRDAALSETRTLLLTSVGRKGDAAIATQAGFSAYLIKPVPWSELYDALSEVMRRPPAPLGEANPLVTRHSLAEARRGRFRVLLVEDDPVNRLVTEWALQRHGYAFESVERASEAIELCSRNHYDLILMDIHMPDMDGYKATGALRARERGRTRTPIVAMTGNALSGERERCLAAGMDDYLTKPIDLGLLCATVERWTHGQQEESAGGRAATGGLPENGVIAATASAAEPRLTESARGPGAGTQVPRISIVGRGEYERTAPAEDVAAAAPAVSSQWEQPFDGDPIDFDRLNDTSMGIPALREALINTFLGDVDERVERLADAVEARDARRVEFEAHGLKGMSATVGARHCVVCFAELERCGRESDLRPTGPPIARARVEVVRVREFIAAQAEGERKAA